MCQILALWAKFSLIYWPYWMYLSTSESENAGHACPAVWKKFRSIYYYYIITNKLLFAFFSPIHVPNHYSKSNYFIAYLLIIYYFYIKIKNINFVSKCIQNVARNYYDCSINSCNNFFPSVCKVQICSSEVSSAILLNSDKFKFLDEYSK